MRGANGEGLELKKYEEILFANLDIIDPERGVKYTKEFQYRVGDIVMCTFLKSGSHWMANMLWKLKTTDDSKRPKDTFLEYGPPELFSSQDDPRIILTHFKPNRLYPAHIENKGKVVLMLRNPKDAMVSWYHHMKNSRLMRSKQTWDEYFQSYIEGDIPFGSYFAYLGQWEQILKDISEGKSKLQVEVFYYEEFLPNPKENIVRLNKFLGFNRDEEYLERVLQETTIHALRDRYNTDKRLINDFCCDVEGRSLIFRKGIVGDWKSQLTVAQSEAVDKLLQETLRHGLISFKYEI